jgi:hypothetical protein
VRTRILRTGQAIKSPLTQTLYHQTQSDLVRIGGFIHYKKQPDLPLAGTQVGIKGTAYLATSSEDGRFSLGGFAPGKYTLVVWPPEGKPQEFPITVPSSQGTYDIEI